MPRRKSAPVNAPTTLAEATAIAGEYAKAFTTVEGMRAHYDKIIADLQAERDALIEPIETGMKDLFVSLRAWWAVSADAVTGGSRKTAEIAGVLLGLRMNTPSLKMPKGITLEEVVAWLDDSDLDDFLTVSTKLNKSALIKALRGPDDVIKAQLLNYGLTQNQSEQFFIDRLKETPATSGPETVTDDALEGVAA